MRNKKIKKIVSVGCSHMFGSEIRGEGKICRVNDRHPHLTFAGKVAEVLGCEHEDLSEPGGSNTYIRETAVEHLVGNVNADTTLYLIGWTTYSRHYFYAEDPNTGEEIKYHWAQGVEPGGPSEEFGTDFTLLFDYFKLYMTNDEDGRRRRMNDTVLLSNMFAHRKVPYVMLSSCSTWMPQDFEEHHPKIGRKWKKFFPWNNYYEPYGSFVEKMRDKRPETFSSSLHGNEIAHKNYAIGLRNFIKELYFEENK